ncbi:MAG: Hsp20 family protein [Bdellovibrionaceae bacterium]|nr:Hsp20 family protein [Bdellovibrio sp.]
MAESIKPTSPKTYLRQIQQEQAQKKRDLMAAQKEELKSLRQHFTEQSMRVDAESAAAINHIKSGGVDNSIEARAERGGQAKLAAAQREAEVKELRAGQFKPQSPASRAIETDPNNETETVGDKQQIYNRKAQTSAAPKQTIQQNYETKETDDFYRVQNRGSRISENQQGYVIEAYAPEHEKDNLRVSIHRNRAVVSGQRKFGDQADDGTKIMRTNNFQTFREEFKFDRPVSNEGMTRERVGDYVRFTIPKLEAMENPEIDET